MIEQDTPERCRTGECSKPAKQHCSQCLTPLCDDHAEFTGALELTFYCETCWEVWTKSLQDGKVGEAGALFAFMGWLTTRKAVSGPFSGSHEAGQSVELIRRFCESQGWEITDDTWHRHLKTYPLEETTGGGEMTVVVSARFFEHLLACLANQKFIHDVNADGMSEGSEHVTSVQTEMQAVIDTAYREGWGLLRQQIPTERVHAESEQERETPVAPTTVAQLQQAGRVIQGAAKAIGTALAPLSSVCSGGSIGPLNGLLSVGDSPYPYMGPPPYSCPPVKLVNLDGTPFGLSFNPKPERIQTGETKMTITYPTTTTITLTPDELRTMIREEMQSVLQEIEDDPTPSIVTITAEEVETRLARTMRMQGIKPL